MHQCQSCGTAFEMPPEPELGYFLRGRCNHCGTVNVIVPGLGTAPGAEAAPPRVPAAEDASIEVAEEALDIVEDDPAAAAAPDGAGYGGAVPETASARRKGAPPPPPRKAAEAAPAKPAAGGGSREEIVADVDTEDL